MTIIRRAISVYNRILKAVKFLAAHLRNPSALTYYPEEERKSHFRIIIENLVWMFRYHEINHFYYMYGLDRRHGTPVHHFCHGTRASRIKRDRANKIGLIGGHSTKHTARSDYLCLLRDKFIFGRYLHVMDFPTPNILALCKGRSVLWHDDLVSGSLEEVLGMQDLDVFVKPVLGGCGEEVYAVTNRDGVLRVDATQVDIEQAAARLAACGYFIVQERVHQHEQMGLLYPSSVNTIRVATIMQSGRPVFLSSFFRVGVGGRKIDNLAAGGIIVGIDHETGELLPEGKFKPGYGKRITCHPDTEREFSGFVLPYYKDSVQLCLDVHKVFYGVHSIGWDIAVTPEGPTILEGNDEWDMMMLQVWDHDLYKKFISSLPASS